MIDIEQLNKDIGNLRYNRPKSFSTIEEITYSVEWISEDEKKFSSLKQARVVFSTKKGSAKITLDIEIYSINSQDAIAQAIFNQVEGYQLGKIAGALHDIIWGKEA